MFLMVSNECISTARRGLLMTAAIAILAILTQPLSAQDVPPVPDAGAVGEAGVMVDTIEVRGHERIPEAAVIGTTGLNIGAVIRPPDIPLAIRRLMATGEFEHVEVRSRRTVAGGTALIIEVEERPFIASFDFEGLERINARTVRDSVGLEGNQTLRPSVVPQTEALIRDLLGQRGVQVISVDTALTPVGDVDEGYRLTFRVVEGQRLAIAEVEFHGNTSFPDRTLERQMATRPEGFLWFRQGRLDRDVLAEDLQQRLPDFYGARGFIDFTVVSDSVIVDQETGKARLVVEVDEGPQYRIGEFDVQGNTRFSTERILEMLTLHRRGVLGLPFGPRAGRERGDVFDELAVRDVATQLGSLYRNEGYLYSEVRPRIERRGEVNGEPTVDVTLEVVERQPFYINRIEIAGNTRTHESVIRDRIFVLPGQIYNEDRLIQSYQSISGLGFFETPMPTPDIRPDPEAGTVDIVFEVEEKQTGSINFGTSLGGYGRAGGLSGFLGYEQPNLFGQAKQAAIRAEYGWRNTFEASYTDPALFGTRNSGSVSLFHMQDRFSPFSDGRRTRTGASVRFGVPLMGLRFTRAFVGYTLAQTSYDAFEQAEDDPENIFLLPEALASGVTVGLTRDTKNHPIFPTVGTRQSLNVEQTGGPLGGDGNFQKLVGDFEWWVPAGRIGGDQPGERPIQFTLGLRARTGTLFGDATRFPLERFYVGGVQDGIQLRGYEEASITPQGYLPRGRGAGDRGRLGDAFLVMSAEYAVRLNDNISVQAFADAGNNWARAGHIDPTRLFRGAGLGVTLVTPFGPLGLDYAYGFDRPEPGWQFHFRLGPGF